MVRVTPASINLDVISHIANHLVHISDIVALLDALCLSRDDRFHIFSMLETIDLSKTSWSDISRWCHIERSLDKIPLASAVFPRLVHLKANLMRDWQEMDALVFVVLPPALRRLDIRFNASSEVDSWELARAVCSAKHLTSLACPLGLIRKITHIAVGETAFPCIIDVECTMGSCHESDESVFFTDVFPHSVKSLEFCVCQLIEELPRLPPMLEHLDCVSCNYLRSFPPLPPSLKTLRCVCSDRSMKGLTRAPDELLPACLQRIELMFCTWIESLPAVLPDALRELILCELCKLTQLPPLLPAGLLLLDCRGCKLLTRLPSSVPPGLEYLNCTRTSIRQLPPIPNSVKRLHHNNINAPSTDE